MWDGMFVLLENDVHVSSLGTDFSVVTILDSCDLMKRTGFLAFLWPVNWESNPFPVRSSLFRETA